MPGNFEIACRQFNGEQFFECHESFEEIWQEEQGPVRDLYKGLIQIAAAFVHISRRNFGGADRLSRTGLGYLAPYREEGAMGFDVDAIMTAAEKSHSGVLALGRARMDAFDISVRPVYGFDIGLLAAEARRWGAWGFDSAGNALPMEIAVVE